MSVLAHPYKSLHNFTLDSGGLGILVVASLKTKKKNTKINSNNPSILQQAVHVLNIRK